MVDFEKLLESFAVQNGGQCIRAPTNKQAYNGYYICLPYCTFIVAVKMTVDNVQPEWDWDYD